MGVGSLSLFSMRAQGSILPVRLASELTSWIAFGFGCLFSATVFFGPASDPSGYFNVGALQGILVPYILLMGVLVKRFSYHYLQSDERYPFFFIKIKLLICFLLLFVVLNHSLLMLFTWMASGWMMYFLISHTATPSAMNAAKLALRYFLIGDLLMIAGFLWLFMATGSVSLTDWLALPQENTVGLLMPVTCIAIAAFSKTAIIPFSQWFPHTLVSATPVSAIMHAGFVNAGAVLLAKIAPLLIHQPVVMSVIFCAGLLSALAGSTAMLVQTDVKRYLIFSTIGQMGFMMMECGLGAFHLAILHLMVHGFFKARLFLSSGRVIEHRQPIRNIQMKQELGSPLRIRLKAAICILSGSVLTWLLVLQVPVFKSTLSHLPTTLIVVLSVSILFTYTTFVKAMGVNRSGLIVSLLFSLLLLILYVAYEVSAQTLLSELNYTQAVGHVAVLQVGAAGLLIAAGLAWLSYLRLLPLPLKLKDSCYVYLLNATNTFRAHSTFSNR